MYLSLVFLPFLGSFVCGFFGRYLGKKGTALISISCVSLSFILSLAVFYEVGFKRSVCHIFTLSWLESGSFYANWSFLFDSLTISMLLVVTFISSLVHLYSTEYMGEDPHLPRFLSYLSLFTFFMLLLVTGDNLVQLFVGWEGVGLSSYLLINFWFTRIQANKAAIKAMLVNRVGDLGLALAIFGIYKSFGAVDYSTIFALAPLLSSSTLNFFGFEFEAFTLIGTLLLIGAAGKSAQLGLHTWLPDAMEGPTPVSALIHAATLVTAGVFLLVRCSPLLEHSPKALTLIVLLGGTTCFFAATTALVQNDIKRVIAYSTCSQLGYMFFSCGLSNYSGAVFHLVNHAFFKALLFLGAGSVIHAIRDEQDLRKMGGLRRLLPFTYAMVLIGSLSLMGMPFLTGFYSKDAILESSYAAYSNSSHYAYWLGSLGAFCTSFYSIRLLALCFLSEPNGNRTKILLAHESHWPISTALGLLAIPSIFWGYFSKDLFIGLGTDFWGNALFCLPKNLNTVDAEFLPSSLKLFPLICSFFGGILSFYSYQHFAKYLFAAKTSSLGRKIYVFFNRKWFFDKIYNDFLGQGVLIFGHSFTYKLMDRGFMETIGPQGIGNLLVFHIAQSRLWHSGLLYHYLVVMVWSTLLFGLLQFLGYPSLRVTMLIIFATLWSVF